MTDADAIVPVPVDEYLELLSWKNQLKGEFTHIGWIPPDEWFIDDVLTAREEREMLNEWAFNMQSMVLVHRASNFWIGDHINFGEYKFGEKFAQALPDPYSSFHPGTIRNIASTCGLVPISLRNDKASWSHHVEVSQYSHDVIPRLLDKTVRHQWSVRQLRGFIARWHRMFGDIPVTTRRSRAASGGGAVVSLPLYTTVREQVLERYPGAKTAQASDMAQFVVTQIEKYATTPVGEINLRKHAKRTLRYRKLMNWWRSRAEEAEDKVDRLYAENKMLYDRIVAAQGEAMEKEYADRDWMVAEVEGE